MKTPGKALLRGAAEFACVLALGLAPWPGLDHAFAGAFCASANALGFERTLASGLLTRLSPAASGELEATRAHAPWHAMFRVENPSLGNATRLAFNTRATVYVPGVAFLAFLVASRAWKRPRALVGVLSGALVIFAFSGLALTLSVVRFLALPRVGALELGQSSSSLIDALFLAWIVPPGMAYAVPLVGGTLMLWLSRTPERLGARAA